MFRKRQPVLTGQYCEKMEKLRLAIEVLYGERASFVHIDFNTGHARLRTSTEIDISFPDFYPNDLAFIGIRVEGVEKYDWHIARFDFAPDEVYVINDRNPVGRGPEQMHTVWWAGRSATERRLEPLDRRTVEYCAQLRGLSVEDYLNLEN